MMRVVRSFQKGIRFAPLAALALVAFGFFCSSILLTDKGTVNAQTAVQAKPKVFVQEIPGTTVKFELVFIPDGEFVFADPTKGGQKRKVKVKGFWLGRTEVTWDEYDVFLYKLDLTEDEEEETDAYARPSRPYGAPDMGWGHHGYPAINIHYQAAEQYCRWLSYKTKRKFRLPTEAEWERAARGGTTGPFSFDTSANPSWSLGCVAFPQAEPNMWWCNNSGNTTHPAGSKQANPYGLHDMHGNVWEWVGDWYASYPSAAVTDPTGPSSGSNRILRSGSWSADAQICRSAYRGYGAPGERSTAYGFRLARSL